MYKFHRLFVFLFCVIVIIAGCGRDISKKIRGQWVVDDNPELLTMEFFKDGHITSTYKVGVKLEGTWRVQNDSLIEIKLDTWDLTGQLREDKLILKSGDREKVYRKIK